MARAIGIQICIDVRGPHDVPAGDFAVSYLLHLRDDLGSRKMIHTLGSLLHAAESTPHSKDDSSMFAWWEEVGENFSNLAEMEPEDWDEEEFEEVEEDLFEEIVEDEPAPFADFELPPPGDYQALREMFEQLRGDVQRLQEESD
jgi:hypothetical protein